jgi:hypothetical protein
MLTHAGLLHHTLGALRAALSGPSRAYSDVGQEDPHDEDRPNDPRWR